MELDGAVADLDVPLAIGDAMGVSGLLAIPVGCWREGEGAVVVVFEAAVARGDFEEATDREAVAIDTGCVWRAACAVEKEKEVSSSAEPRSMRPSTERQDVD